MLAYKEGTMKDMKKLKTIFLFLLASTFICGSLDARDFTGKKSQIKSKTAIEQETKAVKTETAQEKKEKSSPKFPEKGWHKGFWITAMGGMMQASEDENVDDKRKFDGMFIPSFGLSLGYDIADWIGSMIQFQYGTTSDQVGDGTADHPLEDAREHDVKIRLMARATLPYFTRADWQPNKIKIIPYLKLGGTAGGLYVNAPTNGNKVGAWGGGVALGAGLETLVLDRIWIGFDLTEDLMFLQDYYRTINNAKTKIIEGGFKPAFSLVGMVGYHF